MTAKLVKYKISTNNHARTASTHTDTHTDKQEMMYMYTNRGWQDLLTQLQEREQEQYGQRTLLDACLTVSCANEFAFLLFAWLDTRSGLLYLEGICTRYEIADYWQNLRQRVKLCVMDYNMLYI